MKKLMMAVGTCVCALGAFGGEEAEMVCYVNANNPNPKYPYTTPETACCDFDTVWTMTPAPTEIHIAPGTYNVDPTKQVYVLDRAVKVIGDDPDSVYFYSSVDGSKKAIFTLNHEDAFLSGIKLECQNSGNWIATPPGGIDIIGGTVSNVLVTKSMSHEAGSVALRGPNARFVDSRMTQCKLASAGKGVLLISEGLADRVTVEGTTSGYANLSCTGILLQGTNAVCRNSLITGNTCNGGSATDFKPAVRVTKGLLENCTVVNNNAGNGGNAGVYIGSTNGVVRNCIIIGNKGADLSTINVAAADADCLANVSNSCSPELTVGVNNNLALDPKFTDAANGDYTLQETSPCINTGADTDAPLDLVRNPRKYNGSLPDMGCYEFQGEPVATELIVSFAPTVAYGLNELDTTFNATVIGARSASLTCEWDFGDGSSVAYTAVPTVDHHYSAPGEYTVVLSCDDGFLTGVCTNTCIFVNSDDPVRYVNASCPTPKYPYTTPETASHDFDVVWTMNPAPTEIHVGPGTYTVNPTKQVYVLDRAVKVIGDDPDSVYFYSSVGDVGKAIFTLNHADAFLSGIKLECQNSANNISTPPGGIDIIGGTVSNVVVTKCISHKAGSVSLRGPNARFVDSRMTQCRLASAGNGVLLISEGLADRVTVEGTTANYANLSCTGILLQGPNAVCRNSLITGNTCNGGSATDLKPAVRVTKGLLENCTVVNNNAGNGGNAGVYVGSTDAVVRNCIITGNKGADVSTINVAAADADCLANVSNSCSPDLTVGVNGNLTLDPVFTDAAHGDYSLQETSPCINTGADTDAPLDYVRNPRKYNGSLPDMGCYEFQGEPVATEMIVSFAPTVSHGLKELDTIFIATVLGARGEVGYEWDFGDGSSVEKTDVPTADHHYSAPGEYTVVLSCDDGFLTGVCTNTCIFVNSDDPVRYVNASCPTPKYPYTTPETASHDFDVVWTMNPAPAEIHVGPGTYTVNPVKQVYVLDRAVKVIGDDPDSVYFYSSVDGSGKAVFTLNHADALLSGIKLECQNSANYISTPPGGIDIIGGTVSNVLVTKCISHVAGSVALRGPNARFVDSRMAKCKLSSAGNGVLLISEGLADRVTVEGTTSGYANLSCTGILLQGTNAVCRNSLITGNSRDGGSATSAMPAVRVTKGVLENCTVVGNNGGATLCGGICVAADADALVRNCISFGNLAAGSETTKNFMLADGASVSHCCSPDLEDGVNGNVSADPQFQTVNGFAYGFRSSSPCFGAGEKLGWMKGALDYLRQPRLINAPEIGCFESQVKGFLLMVK